MKKFLLSISLVVFSFFVPIGNMILAIIISVGIDTIIGTWASIKAGKSFSSKSFYRIFQKTFIFVMALCGTFVLDKYLLNKIMMLLVDVEYLATNVLAITIVFNEAISVNENIKGIIGVSISERFLKLLKTVKTTKKQIDTIKE